MTLADFCLRMKVQNQLTPKQFSSCHFYQNSGLNATQSAIKAGYSRNGAKQIAFKQLKKKSIQTYMNAYREEVSKDSFLSGFNSFWQNRN